MEDFAGRLDRVIKIRLGCGWVVGGIATGRKVCGGGQAVGFPSMEQLLEVWVEVAAASSVASIQILDHINTADTIHRDNQPPGAVKSVRTTRLDISYSNKTSNLTEHEWPTLTFRHALLLPATMSREPHSSFHRVHAQCVRRSIHVRQRFAPRSIANVHIVLSPGGTMMRATVMGMLLPGV